MDFLKTGAFIVQIWGKQKDHKPKGGPKKMKSVMTNAQGLHAVNTNQQVNTKHALQLSAFEPKISSNQWENLVFFMATLFLFWSGMAEWLVCRRLLVRLELEPWQQPSLVSLSKKVYSPYLVLVSTRNGFKSDLVS